MAEHLLNDAHFQSLLAFFAKEHQLDLNEGLTYEEMARLAPAYGGWLMREFGLSVPRAHLVWGSAWGTWTGNALAAHYNAIALALYVGGAHMWAEPFTPEASGFDAVYVAREGLFDALQIADDVEVREVVEERLRGQWVALHPVDVQTGLATRATEPVCGEKPVLYGLSLCALICHLASFSRLPACRTYSNWYFFEFLPAFLRHGYYNPDTNHQPPPGQELEALERREGLRDHLNDLLPGLGDVSAGQRPSTPEGRRHFGHLLTLEDGQQVFVRDDELPDEPEEDC
jgi:hypothetical protein